MPAPLSHTAAGFSKSSKISKSSKSSKSQRPPTTVPRKIAAAALGACLSLAGVALVGCESDTETADKVAAAKIKDAEMARQSIPTTGDGRQRELVFDSLKAALSEANASAASKAHSARLLAQAEMEAGLALMREAEAKEIQALRLVGEINYLGSQVQTHNVAIAGYKEFDKMATGAVQKDKQNQNLIRQGAAGGAWVAGKGKAGAVPALSTVDRKIKELEAKVAGLKKEQTDAKTEQVRLNLEADRTVRRSEGLKGKESVALYKKGADLRKQASAKSTRFDEIETELVPLQQDLALAKQQKKHLNAALAAFKEREEKNAERKKEIGELLAALAASSTEAVSGDGAEGGTETDGPGGTTPAPGSTDDTETDTPPAAPRGTGTDGGADDEAAESPEPGASRAPAAAEDEGDVILATAEEPAADDEPAAAPAPRPRSGRAAPAPARRAPAATAATAAADDESDESNLDGGPTTKPKVDLDTGRSITQKADRLLKLVTEAQADRQKAEQHLRNAVGHFQEAMDNAAKVMMEVQPKLSNGDLVKQPQKAAWDSLAETFSPGQYHLMLADAHLALAALYRDHADGLAARGEMLNKLRPVLEAAGNTTVPASLTAIADLPAPAATAPAGEGAEGRGGVKKGDLLAQAAAVRGQADAAYAEAEKHLKDAIEAPTITTQAAHDAARKAYVRYVGARYAQGVALIEGGDRQKGEDLIAEARNDAGKTDTDTIQGLSDVDYPAPLLRALGLAGESSGLDAAGGGDEPASTGPTTGATEGGEDTGTTPEGPSEAFPETGDEPADTTGGGAGAGQG